jgi:triacylglycerol esterase/lipase EstA (alpha/beta hydrolase family)
LYLQVLTISSVVAVHGLAAGSSSTWRHENGTSLIADLWAHDPDLPGIRILSFGYDTQSAYYASNSGKSASTGRLMTFAEQLCFDLRNHRMELNQTNNRRPIIFIGHGIGGIVIKRALMDNADILQCTSHVFFFDTPHRGFDCKAWKAKTGHALNVEAQKQFGVGSTTLSEIERGVAGLIGIHCKARFSTFYIPDPPRDWVSYES